MFELASRCIERDVVNYLRPSFDPPPPPPTDQNLLQTKPPSPAPSDISLHSIISAEPHIMHIPLPQPSPKRSWLKRTRDGIYENRGMFFLLISQFFGSLMAMMARLLSTGTMGTQKFHALQILFVRQSITSAGCLIWLWKIGVSPWGDRKIRLLLVARGVGKLLP